MIIIQHLPGLDIDNGILRAWWIDPMVSTISFSIIINIYWYEERKRGLSTCLNPKWFDQTTTTTSRTTSTISSIIPLSILSSPRAQSGIAYWIGIYLWKCFIPPPSSSYEIQSDGIPTNISSFLYLLIEIISGIFLYDFLFFFLHWAMHDIPYINYIVNHKRHHQHRQHHHQRNNNKSNSKSPDNNNTTIPNNNKITTLEARDVLRHSIVDGMLQVLTHIICQRYTPWGCIKSRLARILHNIISIWMLTESHTASPTPNVFRNWCVGVREHRLHHLGCDDDYYDYYEDDCEKKKKKDEDEDDVFCCGNFHRYEQFFGYLDNIRWYIIQKQQQKQKQKQYKKSKQL